MSVYFISQRNVIGIRTLTNLIRRISMVGLLYLGSGSAANAQFTTIPPPGAVGGAQPTGIDGLNVIGVTRTGDGGYASWLYNGSTFSTFADPLAPDNTTAHCISGNLIGGQYVDAQSHQHAFLYDGSNYTTITGNSSLNVLDVTGISGNRYVGNATDSNGHDVGYLYNGTSYQEISDPSGGGYNLLTGISGHTVVGEYNSRSGLQAFEYDITTGLYSDFSFGGEKLTYLSGISGNTLVGTYQDISGLNHGFLYDGVSITTVDDPFSSLPRNGTLLTGVSGGTAVGYYADYSGTDTPFEYQFRPATPPASTPEPGSCALFISAGLTCVGFARRRLARR